MKDKNKIPADPAIKIENCVFKYKNLEIPLLSGEFHYWRVPSENWRKIARKIREMGINIVATYVPWNYHETEPGKYDFTGESSPQRDLIGFIRMLKEEELYAIVRPGPYIYAEWANGGPPERATKYSWLSTEFMEMAEHYISSVCKVLEAEQITKGGNVIMFQAENESYPHIENFGDELGCFDGPGIFTEWLEERYKNDLEDLNKAWQTNLSSFDEACFYYHEECVNTQMSMADRLLSGREFQLRYADCNDFISWYAAKTVAITAEWMRLSGVDVPICANHWSSLYGNFDYFCRDVDLAGSDQYPLAFFEGIHASGIKDNWFYNIDIVKMAEADVSNGNVWSGELQSGCSMWSGYLPAQHFKYVLFTLMGRGLRGWNWYMLVNRDNWSKGPINEWACPNSYFPVHQQIVSAANFMEPWKLTPLYDLSLFVYKPHRTISPGNFEATYRALEEAGINYKYFNPHSRQLPSTNILLYSGDNWIEQKVAGQLDQFVQNGGTLITFNRYPSRDEFGKPLTGLPTIRPDGARPVFLPINVSYRGKSSIVSNAGHGGNRINLCYFKETPGEAMQAELSGTVKETLVDVAGAKASSFKMGYEIRHGQGKIIYIGSNPSPCLLQMITEAEGASQYVTTESPQVSAILHRHENGDLALFVTNRAESANNAKVSLNCKRLEIGIHENYHVENAVTHEVKLISGKELQELIITLDGHDSVILRIKRLS